MSESIVRKTRSSFAGRSGTTLVEVVGTLSVLLVLAISAVAILGSITEIGTRTSQAKQGRFAIERLAKSFRDDVHKADKLDLAQPQSLVVLTTDATTIDYQWDADQHVIQRIVNKGDDRLAIERFQLTDRCRPEVSVDNERVTLTLTKKTQNQTGRTEVQDQNQTGRTEVQDQHQTGLRPWVIEARRP